MSVRSRRASTSPLNATDTWGQSRIAKKYPLYLPVPPSLLAGFPSDDDEVQAQLSRYSFLVEFSHVITLIPSGIYVLPEWSDSHVWRCTIFIREGLWRGMAAPFRLEFPKEKYPNESPSVIFDAPVPPHVDIDAKSGELQLPAEFRNQWSADRFCSLHVLLYVKQIFYDQQCIVGTLKSPNQEFKEILLRSKTEALAIIDRAIRISVTYTARLISRGSNVCPLLIVPEVNNSDVPLVPLGMDDAELLKSAVAEADGSFVVNKDGSTSFQHVGSLTQSKGSGASPISEQHAGEDEDQLAFNEEKLRSLVGALENFSGPSGRMSDPVDGFLEWLSDEYLASLAIPLSSPGNFDYDSVVSLGPSLSSTPKVVISSKQRRASLS